MKTHDDRVRDLISGINRAKTALVVNNNLDGFNEHINDVLDCFFSSGYRVPVVISDTP